MKVQLALARAWFIGFIACFGAGAFLGLSRRGHPLWPGALALWAPAGLLLIAPGLAALAGRLRVAAPGAGRVRGAVMVVLGLGLLGVGLAHLTHDAAFYALGVPALAMIEVWLVGKLIGGPHSPTFANARRRGGASRQWLAYTGAVLIALTIPFLAVAALGFVDLARV